MTWGTPFPQILHERLPKALALVSLGSYSDRSYIIPLVRSFPKITCYTGASSVCVYMVCLYCRKKIGPLRRLRDSQFCCSDHRKKLGTRSARALREAEDLYGFDE